jgi:predicted phage-related endonuclease
MDVDITRLAAEFDEKLANLADEHVASIHRIMVSRRVLDDEFRAETKRLLDEYEARVSKAKKETV